MAFTNIAASDLKDKGVTGLPDTPQLTTEEMQRKFDELAKEVLVPAFNRLVEELAKETAAANIGISIPEGIEAESNIAAVIDWLLNDSGESERLRHSHDNKDVLDLITGPAKTAYDGLVKLFSAITEVSDVVKNSESSLPTGKAIVDYIVGLGGGDMVKAVYDTNNSGVVDDSEMLGGKLPEEYQKVTDESLRTTAKTVPGAINEVSLGIDKLNENKWGLHAKKIGGTVTINNDNSSFLAPGARVIIGENGKGEITFDTNGLINFSNLYDFEIGRRYELLLDYIGISEFEAEVVRATYDGLSVSPVPEIQIGNSISYNVGRTTGGELLKSENGDYSLTFLYDGGSVNIEIALTFPAFVYLEMVESGELDPLYTLEFWSKYTVEVDYSFFVRDVTDIDPKCAPIDYELYGFKVDLADSNPQTRVHYLSMAEGKRAAFWNYVNGYFDFGDWKDCFFIKNNYPCMVDSYGIIEGKLDPENYLLYENGFESSVTDPGRHNLSAMSIFPTIWTKRWEDDNYLYCLICDKQLDSGFRAYMHTMSDGTVVKQKGIGMYHSNLYKNEYGDLDIYRSLSGTAVSNNKTFENELMYTHNIGDRWEMFAESDWATLGDLLTLISRSDDFQKSFGYGCVSNGSTPAATNNTDAGKLYHGGPFYNSAALNTNSWQKVFHIHNLFGNYYTRIAGLINNKGEMLVKPIPPYNATGEGYEDIGITLTGTDDSYCKTSKMNQYGRFPAVMSGGSATTYECDAVAYSKSVVATAMTRGVYSAGAKAGKSSLNLNNQGTASTSVATRISCFIRDESA